MFNDNAEILNGSEKKKTLTVALKIFNLHIFLNPLSCIDNDRNGNCVFCAHYFVCRIRRRGVKAHLRIS